MSSAPPLLREACERGDAEGARRALARGGAHLLDDPLGRSGLGPLHVAADRGRLELLRFLIGRGADIHLRTRGGVHAPRPRLARRPHVVRQGAVDGGR
eukprot:COSAG01_NODE_3889_length_5578_cov_202.537324_2_plen_98_part_00